MTENQKRLREWVHEHARSKAAEATSTALIDAALSDARAEALEEVVRAVSDGGPSVSYTPARIVSLIREMQGTTPPASIPVERVRAVLSRGDGSAPAYMHADEAAAFENGWAAAVRYVEDRLGVPLDAAQEATPKTACLVCGESGQHKMSCRQTERNAAGQRHRADRGPGSVTTGARAPPGLPDTCGGCLHRIHAPGCCIDTYCVCRWTP